MNKPVRSSIVVTLVASTSLLAFPAAANTVVYQAFLDGLSENPSNASPGSGFTTVTFDYSANTMEVAVNFSGLLAAATAAHIHCCAAAPTNMSVAVPLTGFPFTTSGTYNQTFDMTLAGTYNPAFITASGGSVPGAIGALGTGLDTGQAYLNIHSNLYPGGEIRGYLQAVPLPGAVWLLPSAVAALRWVRRKAAA